jgi:hypothetical protein
VTTGCPGGSCYENFVIHENVLSSIPSH